MAVHNCKYCNRVFQPGQKGRSILCEICWDLCERAYIVVYQYLRGRCDPSLTDIIRDTGVAEVFIQAMMMDGRFTRTTERALSKHFRYRPDENLLQHQLGKAQKRFVLDNNLHKRPEFQNMEDRRYAPRGRMYGLGRNKDDKS